MKYTLQTLTKAHDYLYGTAPDRVVAPAFPLLRFQGLHN